MMNPLERELETTRGFATCRGDDDRLDEADAELARLRGIEEAAAEAAAMLREEAKMLRAGSDDSEAEAMAKHDRFMAMADRLSPNSEISG